MSNIRQGAQFVADIPEKAGKVVAMAQIGGKLILACEFGVYELTEAAHPEPRKIREILTLSAAFGEAP